VSGDRRRIIIGVHVYAKQPGDNALISSNNFDDSVTNGMGSADINDTRTRSTVGSYSY
jgi:hypothetical protein